MRVCYRSSYNIKFVLSDPSPEMFKIIEKFAGVAFVGNIAYPCEDVFPFTFPSNMTFVDFLPKHINVYIKDEEIVSVPYDSMSPGKTIMRFISQNTPA